MTDAEILKQIASLIGDGKPYLASHLGRIAKRLEALEAIAPLMAEDWEYCGYDDDYTTRCIHCGTRGDGCSSLEHEEGCPVEIAKRLGVIQ